MSTELLHVRGLSVTFAVRQGRVEAVRGVDFTLNAGECLALVGESGSGKSVTARSLLGLAGYGATVEADELSLDGLDLFSLNEPAWRALRGARIGYVLQDALSSLDPLRRVGDEVAEPLIVHRVGRPAERLDRAVALLDDVGVPDPRVRARQYPHELSGGLRQRALIASAIAAAPAILIADEPTTALDVTVQSHVLDLLSSMRDAGTALLLISHDLSVVARMADRIAVMKDGLIVEQGEAAKILGMPQHPYTRMLLQSTPALTRRPLSSPPGQVVLDINEVSKRYRRPDGSWHQAVDGVSFQLSAGESLGIVGESGSGKSTTAQIVLGMLKPDSGEVRLDNAPWSALSERHRRPQRARIQLIHQDPLGSFDPRFTVHQLIREALGRGQAASRDRVSELLTTVELDDSILTRRGHELSGGQRQRVAIARALATNPEVLVCDEPVSALDVSVQAQILVLFNSLRRDLGVSLLFISHDLGVIYDVCDRVLVMKDGGIVEHGDVSEVFASPQHPYTRVLLSASSIGTNPHLTIPLIGEHQL